MYTYSTLVPMLPEGQSKHWHSQLPSKETQAQRGKVIGSALS